jgi:dTDP-glucose pyrophosphorylase
MRDFVDVFSLFVSPVDQISLAVECIERSGGEIAIVVDADRRLLGAVTDGDVRRGLLRGRTMKSAVAEIMNLTPRFGRTGQPHAELRLLMEQAKVKQLPLIDTDGRVSGLTLLEGEQETQILRNWVVLMAGGLGTRLRPMTTTVPKPMIRVGGKPILQTIIEAFRQNGFFRFAVSVNYLADQIKSFFGDGSRFDAEITYICEAKRLGTAGALSLLPFRPDDDFFVMNCDIVTSVNFGAMMQFHQKSGASATMGVNHFLHKVPYGVVDINGDRLTGLREKPEYEFFVNSGVYVLSPSVLDTIPKNQFFDMTSLFQDLIETRANAAAAFPIHEMWFDIGQPHDLERANAVYGGLLDAASAGPWTRSGSDFS